MYTSKIYVDTSAAVAGEAVLNGSFTGGSLIYSYFPAYAATALNKTSAYGRSEMSDYAVVENLASTEVPCYQE